MTSIVPKDYKLPKPSGKYMKFQQGENRFRVLCDSFITGYEYWTEDKKPIRGEDFPKSKPKDMQVKDGEHWQGQIKHFWALAVWDYADDSVKVLQITQATIQEPLLTLFNDDDWGHPNGYDIVVTRAGEGLETKYSTMAKPAKPMPEEAKKAYADTPVHLKALYDSGDPFVVEEKGVSIGEVPF